MVENKEKYRKPPHRYCPWCATPLPQDTPYRQECPSCKFVLYHHSNPCMGALLLDDEGRVLLGKRGIEPFPGDWNVIGGFLAYGEDPLEGLKREVQEEVGVACVVEEFVAAFADTYGHEGVALLNLYFKVRLLSSEIKAQDDITELKWFPLDELPENMAFESDRKALRALTRMISLEERIEPSMKNG